MTAPTFAVPLAARSDAVAQAGFRTVDARTVVWVEVRGGPHHGAMTSAGGRAVEAAVRRAAEVGIPFVMVLDSAGAEVTEGVAALHAWGGVARALTRVSGVVPTIVGVTGACVSGPALLLGIADAVVMTEQAFAYVTGPEAVHEFTGVPISRDDLGGAGILEARGGIASFVVPDEDALIDAITTLVSFLPDESLADPPRADVGDPIDRDCSIAASIVPDSPTAGFDVRHVLDDVLDEHSLCEVRARYAPNVVTAFGRLDGRAVGVIANQPGQRAGPHDNEASRKAARHV